MTSKPVVLREAASKDIDMAIDYYLAEAGGDVAARFIDSLERAVRQISRYPGSGSPHYAHELSLPGLRSWPVKQFPYLLFYIEQQQHLDVWRVLNGERDIPAWLKESDGL